MSIHNWKNKLSLVFTKIFEDGYELNPHQAEMILKYFETAPVSGFEDTVIDTPFFADIILKTFNKNSPKKDSVKMFVAKMFTKIYSHELQFSKLKDTVDVKRILNNLCTQESCAQNSNLLFGSINVITSPIAHYTGMSWIVEHKLWRNVLCFCTHSRPVVVSRAAYNFITQLLWKLNELEDEMVLTEILEYIITPIRYNHYHTTKLIKEGEERNVYVPMMSFLHVLVEVLSDTEKHTLKINKIVQILTQHFNLQLQLQVLLNVTRDPNFATILCELLFKLYVSCAKDAFFKYNKTESDIMNEVISIYNNIIEKLIMKQNTEAVADFVVNCNLFLAKQGASRQLIFERDGKKFNFQNQFMLHLVVPLWTYYTLNCHSELKLDEIKNYSFKLFNITAEHIVQSASFFHTLVENNRCSIKKIAIHIARNIFLFRGQLNKATAGILYQSLYYFLQTFVLLDNGGRHLILCENPVKTHEDFKLLSLVLDAIKMLLKEHHINWYENLEIICLQETLLNLIKQKFLCTMTLVQTIDLINLSVQKFISPDMTLLIENKSESSLSEIGAVTKEFIQHDDWEIRESAMSLLLTCTNVSFVKYVPLQKIIIKNNLMLLAANCALSDPEVYVQGTALQCLASATKIDKIWRTIMNVNSNLLVQLVYMANRHQEDTIRKESVKVLTEIYLRKNVTPEFSDCIFRLMAGVALNDLSCEVQIVALHFWNHTIRKQGLECGMIDGKFPSVTFSKEKRKIIVLNGDEINRQLSNMMDNLSSIGCLTVLDRCLNEDHNVAVMEEAHKIVKELKVLLEEYKFEPAEKSTSVDSFSINKAVERMDDANESNVEINMPHDPIYDFRDIIIDEILNTKQHDLIIDIFSRTKDDDKEVQLTNNCILDSQLIGPYEFMKKFNSKDYAAIIERKNKYNSENYCLNDIIDEIINVENNTAQFKVIDMCDI